jgi:hypothetical protein
MLLIKGASATDTAVFLQQLFGDPFLLLVEPRQPHGGAHDAEVISDSYANFRPATVRLK